MIMAWLRTTRTVHDVERGSNLDLLIRGFHGIGNRLVDALQAIALALATPNDNSAEVREQVKRLQAARESLQQSIDNEGYDN